MSELAGDDHDVGGIIDTRLGIQSKRAGMSQVKIDVLQEVKGHREYRIEANKTPISADRESASLPFPLTFFAGGGAGTRRPSRPHQRGQAGSRPPLRSLGTLPF
jgi:hypothetical protein